MTIYAASDLHGNLPDIPQDAEVLILAGDICPDFRPLGARGQGHYVDITGKQQGDWLDTEFRAWLNTKPNKCSVIAVWGNHDFVGEVGYHIPTLPWHLLTDETLVLPWRDTNLRIHGTPWVPGLPYWAFYGTDNVLAHRAEEIPHGLDILVSHGPPFGYGDFIPGGTPKQVSKYGNYDGKNVGDVSLYRAIREKQPSYVVCGHIHESRGRYTINQTKVLNTAAVDEYYQLHPDPWFTIDL